MAGNFWAWRHRILISVISSESMATWAVQPSLCWFNFQSLNSLPCLAGKQKEHYSHFLVKHTVLCLSLIHG